MEHVGQIKSKQSIDTLQNFTFDDYSQHELNHFNDLEKQAFEIKTRNISMNMQVKID